MFQIGTQLMKQVGDVTTMGSQFTFGGYEVSMSDTIGCGLSCVILHMKSVLVDPVLFTQAFTHAVF